MQKLVVILLALVSSGVVQAGGFRQTRNSGETNICTQQILDYVQNAFRTTVATIDFDRLCTNGICDGTRAQVHVDGCAAPIIFELSATMQECSQWCADTAAPNLITNVWGAESCSR